MTRTFSYFLSFVLIFTFTVSPALAATDGYDRGASARELREKYEDEKIRILVAAGHEPGYGGAIYQGVYEREIVLEIADELERLLEGNPKYEVIVTRDEDSWHKSLDRYFDREDDEIEEFVEDQKKATRRMERRGDIEDRSDAHVPHATVADDVALRLYGINKWANENDIDLVVNLHVNDAPDHGPNEPSKYTGYAIYIPDEIYGNHATSESLARHLSDRLEALSNVSTYSGESAGVVPDRELIAIGAFGTLNLPSVLIEYGYITEPRFTLPEHRTTVTKDTAYQTYLALQDFFDDPVENPRKVATLPTTWPKPIVATTTPVLPPPVATTTPVVPTPPAMACTPFTDTLSFDIETLKEEVKQLQRILAADSTLYPEGLVTGYFGPATERAVKRFQEKQGIVSSGTPETTGYGAVGPRTAAALLALCK